MLRCAAIYSRCPKLECLPVGCARFPGNVSPFPTSPRVPRSARSRDGRSMQMVPEPQDVAGPRPELIVVAHPDAGLRLQGSRVLGAATDAGPLQRALAETGARARPLFGPSEERVR